MSFQILLLVAISIKLKTFIIIKNFVFNMPQFLQAKTILNTMISPLTGT